MFEVWFGVKPPGRCPGPRDIYAKMKAQVVCG